MNVIGAKTREEVRRNLDSVQRSPIVALKAEEPRRGLEASLRMDIDDAFRATCPNCGTTSAESALALNLSLGPIEEGMQVILVRSGAPMKSVTDEVKRTVLADALRRARGNHAEAARLLDMKYSTFYSMAKRLLSAARLQSV